MKNNFDGIDVLRLTSGQRVPVKNAKKTSSNKPAEFRLVTTEFHGFISLDTHDACLETQLPPMGYTWTLDMLLSLARKAGLTQDVRVPLWRVHDDAHEATPDKSFYVLVWVVLMVNGGTRYEINCKRASGESGLASTQVLKPRKFTRITLVATYTCNTHVPSRPPNTRICTADYFP